MAFSAISNAVITVGSAIKQNLFQKIKDNFDDHETRLASVEGVQTKIKVFDGRLFNTTPASELAIVQTFQAQSSFTLTDAVIKLTGQSLSGLSGNVEIDILKGTSDFDFTLANSVFTTKPSINCATAGVYDVSSNTAFDVSQVSISTGDVLALKITELPTGGVLSQFAFDVFGES
jgi:hypothetical protein